jgi:hypothetical protein
MKFYDSVQEQKENILKNIFLFLVDVRWGSWEGVGAAFGLDASNIILVKSYD